MCNVTRELKRPVKLECYLGLLESSYQRRSSSNSQCFFEKSSSPPASAAVTATADASNGNNSANKSIANSVDICGNWLPSHQATVSCKPSVGVFGPSPLPPIPYSLCGIAPRRRPLLPPPRSSFRLVAPIPFCLPVGPLVCLLPFFPPRLPKEKQSHPKKRHRPKTLCARYQNQQPQRIATGCRSQKRATLCEPLERTETEPPPCIDRTTSTDGDDGGNRQILGGPPNGSNLSRSQSIIIPFTGRGSSKASRDAEFRGVDRGVFKGVL